MLPCWGWLGGYYRIGLVDYAGGDNRRETIAMPFVIVKPKLLTGQSLKDEPKKPGGSVRVASAPKNKASTRLAMNSFLRVNPVVQVQALPYPSQ
jgi:hypothetical protein